MTKLRVPGLFIASALALSIAIPFVLATPVTTVGSKVYLPLVTKADPIGSGAHRVNAPHVGAGGTYGYDQAAIFWFGQVKLAENYADVRAAYEDWGLWLHVIVYDRFPWYDESPSPGEFAAWDSISLYVSPRGNTGSRPGSYHYRFDAMFSPSEDFAARTPFQASYRGNGSDWVAASAPFSSKSTYRGDAGPNGGRCQGWTLTYYVPYSSLGEQGPPPPGTVWGLGLTVHDRDDAAGTPIQDQSWPPDLNPVIPTSWGQFGFGIPSYSPSGVTSAGTANVRQGVGGAVVPDAAVGGTIDYLCPGTDDGVWSQWGEKNFAGAERVVIQNQGDVSDFSCFAKYYVTFPLDAVPAGKAITSASLTMQQFGNSDPSQAKASYIQVMTADRDWSEAKLTWNSAPLAAANFGGSWVYPIDAPWTPVNRTWDVTLPVAQAYAAGQPVRLILYDSDWDMHSGKYFESSDSTAWSGEGRPTLQVTWGTP